MKNFITYLKQNPLKPLAPYPDEYKISESVADYQEIQFDDAKRSITDYANDFIKYANDICDNALEWKMTETEETFRKLNSCIERIERELVYQKNGLIETTYSDVEMKELLSDLKKAYNRVWSYNLSQGKIPRL